MWSINPPASSALVLLNEVTTSTIIADQSINRQFKILDILDISHHLYEHLRTETGVLNIPSFLALACEAVAERAGMSRFICCGSELSATDAIRAFEHTKRIIIVASEGPVFFSSKEMLSFIHQFHYLPDVSAMTAGQLVPEYQELCVARGADPVINTLMRLACSGFRSIPVSLTDDNPFKNPCKRYGNLGAFFSATDCINFLYHHAELQPVIPDRSFLRTSTLQFLSALRQGYDLKASPPLIFVDNSTTVLHLVDILTSVPIHKVGVKIGSDIQGIVSVSDLLRFIAPYILQVDT